MWVPSHNNAIIASLTPYQCLKQSEILHVIFTILIVIIAIFNRQSKLISGL
jgi:hypothetical protein